jgi:hypothetical protein
MEQKKLTKKLRILYNIIPYKFVMQDAIKKMMRQRNYDKAFGIMPTK